MSQSSRSTTHTHRILFGKGGILLMSAETPVANSLPQSAITVSVRGIPTNANNTQKALPPVVSGTIFPYPAEQESMLQSNFITRTNSSDLRF